MEAKPVVDGMMAEVHLGSARAREVFNLIKGDAHDVESTIKASSEFIQAHLKQMESLREVGKFTGQVSTELVRSLREDLKVTLPSVFKAILEQNPNLPILDQGYFAKQGNALQSRFAGSISERVAESGAITQQLGEGLDYSGIRSEARVIRSRLAMGEQLGPKSPQSEFLSTQKNELLEEQKKLTQAYEESKKDQSVEGKKLTRDLASQIASTSNLRQELINIIEHIGTKQANHANNAMKFMGNVISTLGLGSLASRAFISEPFKFGTQPALSVLGNQGQMGSVLSGAMGELEAYNVELNQMVANTGMSMMVGGFAKGGWKGGLIAAGGALTSMMGFGNVGDDFLRDIGITTDEGTIIGQSLAKSFSDPSRMIQNFETSRAGLIASGGLGVPNFGYSMTGELNQRSTGNVILDRILSGGDNSFNYQTTGGADALTALGYSQEELGALNTQAALSLRGGDRSMTSLSNAAASIGGAYGLSPDQIMSYMQTAERFGSRDAVHSVARHADVFANEEGEVSSFAMNVLVPALMKVTESMAMRNLARGTEELTQEVTNFAGMILSGDGRLSELAKANPDIIGAMLSGLSESTYSATQDPAMMAYSLASGNTMYDVFMGKPKVAIKNLMSLAAPIFNSGITTVQGLSDAGLLADYAHSAQALNIDPRMALGIFETLAGLGVSVDELFTDEGDFDEAAMDRLGFTQDVKDRLMGITDSSQAQLAAKQTEQVNSFLQISQGLITKLQALQTDIMSFMSDTLFTDLIGSMLDENRGTIEGMISELREGPGDGFMPRMSSKIDDIWDWVHGREPGTTSGRKASEAADSAAYMDVVDEVSTAVQEAGGSALDPSFYQSENIPDDWRNELAGFGIAEQNTAFRKVMGELNLSPELLESFYSSYTEGGHNFLDSQARREGGVDMSSASSFFSNFVTEHGIEGIDLDQLGSAFGMSSGGFTGGGGRHIPVGTVHAGEYVISSDKVGQNREVLDRIQSGEKISGGASIDRGQGNVTYLTLKVHGMSPEDITNTARRVTEDYVLRNRLNYS